MDMLSSMKKKASFKWKKKLKKFNFSCVLSSVINFNIMPVFHIKTKSTVICQISVGLYQYFRSGWYDLLPGRSNQSKTGAISGI